MFKRRSSHWLVTLFFFVAISSPALAADTQPTFALHNIQLNRLMRPSNQQIKHEEAQRVYIYIGMKDIDIDRAMDTQFERIEKFLFAATIVTDKHGKALHAKGHIITEDDGC